MLVDSHCHLDFPDFAPELDDVVARARAAGVGAMLTISTRVAKAQAYRALAERYADVFFTIGTHPHQAAEEPDVSADDLVTLAAHPRCVGIGEAGLDYHYGYSPKDVSERVFRTHIAAARATGLPLVIHARDADEDMIRILEDETGQGAFKAVLHCFSSGPELARAGLRLGLYVSFSGILTFNRSEEIRAIAAEVPLDRLLVETDAPYLAPPPHRGKRNEPAYVVHTNAVLARVKGVSPDAMAQATTDNFFRLFDKAVRPVRASAA
ncbi:TatD family hydrolase [Alsobacter sp. KACC 23698]|uniref:TatD family hydrolase n=1 Tax=Alsobacter sp. KACC 23698 TaxID=3149229 RepID=A0AAU7JM65_9HYPH